MIEFSNQTEFELEDSTSIKLWIQNVLNKEQKVLGDLQYVFCDDDFLHRINVTYLNHDTFTDIITFDYTNDDVISGEIYISIERVRDNALSYGVGLKDELDRVIVHGVLHVCGYPDKTEDEKGVMRAKEDECLLMRN